MKTQLFTKSNAFDTLVDEWNELTKKSPLKEVFFNWQWQSTWWEHFGNDKELRLLAFRKKSDELVGLASFVIEKSPEGKKRMRFLGGTDVTDYLDIIAQSGYEEDICKNTMDFFNSTDGEWDSIDLHCLQESSVALTELKECLVEGGYSVEVFLEDVCPKITLPSSWEGYLALLNKKDRHELRRKIRRIENLNQYVTDYSIKDFDSLTSAMGHFLSLHRKSNVKKEAFLNNNMEGFFQAVAHILFHEKWLNLSFLQIDGVYVASYLCFDYQNKRYLYNSGYDPEYSHLSPGIVLVSYLIKEAIDSGKREFDFLRGNEPYKYRLGAQDSQIYRMSIKKDG